MLKFYFHFKTRWLILCWSQTISSFISCFSLFDFFLLFFFTVFLFPFVFLFHFSTHYLLSLFSSTHFFSSSLSVSFSFRLIFLLYFLFPFSFNPFFHNLKKHELRLYSGILEPSLSLLVIFFLKHFELTNETPNDRD